ncbi:dipeptidase [Bacillus cereus]|uniref:dipeptidase n=1 Tax=Bacillus cereus TaxID=1396 RepID=UPI000B5EDD70|nr:dipeptidase [Bacillus cereus]ASL62540.1 Acetylornithine deacetylase/Succinyl-diaminopimelate desuccinylase [Bacillus cereus]
MSDWKTYLEEHEQKFLDEFIEFLRIPSLSTLPEYSKDLRQAANWLANRMTDIGLEHVEICETGGHPVVYGDWLHVDGAPTILLYGHYDVQPAEPLELWQSPPFEPQVRDGRIYARGASDMKGNVLTMLHACEAHLKTTGTLPVNVKIIIEGEEEIGSPSLPKWLSDNRERLSCDFAVNSDSGQISLSHPTVIVGTKGVCGVEIKVKTNPSDLHSGFAGGIVHNALHVMANIVASFHGSDGRINVQGMYDDVVPPSAEDREMCAKMPLSESAFRSSIGVDKLISEPGFSPIEVTWFRPTLSVNGMWGGYQGEGTKTIIPCEAHAKVTCRLASSQSPSDIVKKISAHVLQYTPEGVKAIVTPISGSADPYLTPDNFPVLRAADAALTNVMGGQPMHMRMGLTVPILGMLHKLLGIEVVSLGFSGMNDNIHAPNESQDLALYRVGSKVFGAFFESASDIRL